MFEIVICDDDVECLKQTRQFVSDWTASCDIPIAIKTIDNGDGLLDYCKKSHPDIILLDIIMPFISGIDVAKEIRESNATSKIIFLTSSPEFAIESYDVNASGYLLKPVDRDKLYKLLDKCRYESSRQADSLSLHAGFGYQNIYLHTIEYLEVQNKKVIINLIDGRRIETTGTLSYYEKLLPLEKGFFKCHRSYIIYLPAIDHFSNTEIVTRNGIRLPIARGMGKMFNDSYFSYMFRK